MSSSDLPTQSLQTSTLGSGIVGLFIQGIEAGLVFAQFSQWFYGSDRSEGSLSSAVIVFVTVVGLVQSGLSFASAWSQYVQNFGVLMLPKWPDYLQSVPTLAISVPVQALMIRRCYYLVNKNMFIVIPLVLLLVTSTIFSLWSTISIIRFVISIDVKDTRLLLQRINISWLYLISILLPSMLDIILTGILLRYLTQTMKRVYATRIRKRISRLTNIVWQSALPPTLCTTFLCVIYVRFSTAHQEALEHWPKVIQAMIGKLYIISLFYMINARPPQLDEGPTTLISTLTVPTEMYTRTREARGGDIMCSEIIVESGPARTVNFAV